MKYIFINDVHLFAPHALWSTVEDFYKALYMQQSIHGITDDRVYPNGDNFEANNCRKKDIDLMLAEGKKFQEKFKNTWLPGNHELGMFTNDPEFRVIEVGGKRWLITHGHIPWWGMAKAYEYVNGNKVGAGFMKRNFVKMSDALRHLIPVKIKPDYQARAEMYMKQYNCTGIIQGHKHPTHTIDETINGFRHIVFPRGINVIEL